ncbi:MAG: hypothetical protein ACREP9_23060, partial [Candidatus Dormibacteraceae bacterium]
LIPNLDVPDPIHREPNSDLGSEFSRLANHRRSKPMSPGGNDNASGVAVLLAFTGNMATRSSRPLHLLRRRRSGTLGITCLHQ